MRQGARARAAILALAFGLTACGGGDGGGDAAERQASRDRAKLYAWRAQTEQGVKALLRDPESATFSDWRIADLQGTTIFCARVNAKNGFGGYSGPQRFIGGGSSVTLEDQTGAAAMDEFWARACVDSKPFR